MIVKSFAIPFYLTVGLADPPVFMPLCIRPLSLLPFPNQALGSDPIGRPAARRLPEDWPDVSSQVDPAVHPTTGHANGPTMGLKAPKSLLLKASRRMK